MRIKISSEYLFTAFGLAGAGMLEIVPDKHVFAWVLIVLAFVILLSGLRIDGWHVQFRRPHGWRARMNAWVPWVLIVGGPVLGLFWLYLANPDRSSPEHETRPLAWSKILGLGFGVNPDGAPFAHSVNMYAINKGAKQVNLKDAYILSGDHWR